MIVTAPIFWIYIGVLELWFTILEGVQYWADIIFEPDDEDEEEVVEEKK
jgi:hypothetical protein